MRFVYVVCLKVTLVIYILQNKQNLIRLNPANSILSMCGSRIGNVVDVSKNSMIVVVMCNADDLSIVVDIECMAKLAAWQCV